MSDQSYPDRLVNVLETLKKFMLDTRMKTICSNLSSSFLSSKPPGQKMNRDLISALSRYFGSRNLKDQLAAAVLLVTLLGSFGEGGELGNLKELGQLIREKLVPVIQENWARLRRDFANPANEIVLAGLGHALILCEARFGAPAVAEDSARSLPGATRDLKRFLKYSGEDFDVARSKVDVFAAVQAGRPEASVSGNLSEAVERAREDLLANLQVGEMKSCEIGNSLIIEKLNKYKRLLVEAQQKYGSLYEELLPDREFGFFIFGQILGSAKMIPHEAIPSILEKAKEVFGKHKGKTHRKTENKTNENLEMEEFFREEGVFEDGEPTPQNINRPLKIEEASIDNRVKSPRSDSGGMMNGIRPEPLRRAKTDLLPIKEASTPQPHTTSDPFDLPPKNSHPSASQRTSAAVNKNPPTTQRLTDPFDLPPRSKNPSTTQRISGPPPQNPSASQRPSAQPNPSTSHRHSSSFLPPGMTALDNSNSNDSASLSSARSPSPPASPFPQPQKQRGFDSLFSNAGGNTVSSARLGLSASAAPPRGPSPRVSLNFAKPQAKLPSRAALSRLDNSMQTARSRDSSRPPVEEPPRNKGVPYVPPVVNRALFDDFATKVASNANLSSHHEPTPQPLNLRNDSLAFESPDHNHLIVSEPFDVEYKQPQNESDVEDKEINFSQLAPIGDSQINTRNSLISPQPQGTFDSQLSSAEFPNDPSTPQPLNPSTALQLNPSTPQQLNSSTPHPDLYELDQRYKANLRALWEELASTQRERDDLRNQLESLRRSSLSGPPKPGLSTQLSSLRSSAREAISSISIETKALRSALRLFAAQTQQRQTSAVLEVQEHLNASTPQRLNASTPQLQASLLSTKKSLSSLRQLSEQTISEIYHRLDEFRSRLSLTDEISSLFFASKRENQKMLLAIQKLQLANHSAQQELIDLREHNEALSLTIRELQDRNSRVPVERIKSLEAENQALSALSKKFAEQLFEAKQKELRPLEKLDPRIKATLESLQRENEQLCEALSKAKHHGGSQSLKESEKVKSKKSSKMIRSIPTGLAAVEYYEKTASKLIG